MSDIDSLIERLGNWHRDLANVDHEAFDDVGARLLKETMAGLSRLQSQIERLEGERDRLASINSTLCDEYNGLVVAESRANTRAEQAEADRDAARAQALEGFTGLADAISSAIRFTDGPHVVILPSGAIAEGEVADLYHRTLTTIRDLVQRHAAAIREAQRLSDQTTGGKTNG